MTAAPPEAAAEEALIPLSALQHHLFCPRQCALIHVEQLWAEDGATAAGRLLHARVDAGKPESRPGLRTARSLAIRSFTLGVAGVADVVEFHGAAGQPYPVEYKRGRPKAHRADEVQLCAQAICLEEMFAQSVPEGALFYGETRRRQTVVFDAALRDLTQRVARQAAGNIHGGHTPPPVPMPACKHCSLHDLCQPECLHKSRPVLDWLARSLA